MDPAALSPGPGVPFPLDLSQQLQQPRCPHVDIFSEPKRRGQKNGGFWGGLESLHQGSTPCPGTVAAWEACA